MIAPYLLAAIAAPLADRPNHQVAEIHFIAERDQCSPFGAALELFARERLDRAEPELKLPGDFWAVGRA